MRKTIGALVALTAIVGFVGQASADPSSEDQTSAEQVKMCAASLQTCETGDTRACVSAIKICVGSQRQTAMKLMEEG